MGWLTLPAPGSEHGPCTDGCSHIDCQATRDDAAASCRDCKKPIGYDVKFYGSSGDGSIAHAVCVWKRPGNC